MSGSPQNHKSTALDRRIDGDRREQSCRRHAQDGKGSNADHSEAAESVRAYTFRSFSDRRGRNERRLVAGTAGRRATDRQEHTDEIYEAEFVDLSPEEVLALLHHPEK